MYLSEDKLTKLTVVEPGSFNEISYIRDFCAINNLQMAELITDTFKIIFVINSDVVLQLKEDVSGKVYDFMELLRNV